MSQDLRSTHYAEVAPALSGNRLVVWEALQRFGPCTGSELAAAMGWPATSVLPRLCELYKSGRAQATGIRRGNPKRHVFLAVARVQQMELLSA